MRPPSLFPEGTFDLIYAISVFTHLTMHGRVGFSSYIVSCVWRDY